MYLYIYVVTATTRVCRLANPAVDHLRQSVGVSVPPGRLRASRHRHTTSARPRISQGLAIQNLRQVRRVGIGSRCPAVRSRCNNNIRQ